MAKRTACVTFNDDGLVHLVELSAHKDRAHGSHMWCESFATVWVDPPVVPGPPTCLYCLAAKRPAKLGRCDEG